jgi:hypothetical protein
MPDFHTLKTFLSKAKKKRKKEEEENKKKKKERRRKKKKVPWCGTNSFFSQKKSVMHN